VQVTAEEFYLAVNVSKPSFIRVEADELTYDYHIMLRVEIEAELMDGSLEVAVSGKALRTSPALFCCPRGRRKSVCSSALCNCAIILCVQEIPARWSSAMLDSLGISPPSDTLGCLQDVHWSAGYIGSFASYTIGK
jgi:carboxypeptidase Taq